MISTNGAFMTSSRSLLDAIEQEIRTFDREGQLRRAVYGLLGRDDSRTEWVCRRHGVDVSSSTGEDARILQRLFKYNIYTRFLFWTINSTDTRKVLQGALMLIGYGIHDLTPKQLAAAENTARAASRGRLYTVLRTLFGDKQDEVAAVCNRLRIQLSSNNRFSDDVTTLSRRVAFPIDKYMPETFVQGALVLLGIDVCEGAWSPRLDENKHQGILPDIRSEVRAEGVPKPRLLPSPTALLLVLQASKLRIFPTDGQTVTSDEVDSWLLDATYFTCRQPAEADELEFGLRLTERIDTTGEEDIYIRVSLTPESAPRRITKFDLRQSLAAAGGQNAQVLKVRRVDVRDSGDAMSKFEYS